MAEQANIPRVRPLRQVQPPDVRDLATVTAVEIYNRANEPRVHELFIHNIGATEIKYAINTEASLEVFHDVLAADTGVDKGLGTKESFKLSDLAVESISIIPSAINGRVTIIKYALQHGWY